jgi:hypothetical protein
LGLQLETFKIQGLCVGNKMAEILCDDATPTSPCHSIIATIVDFERIQRRLKESQGVCSLTWSASEPTQSQLRLDAGTVDDSNIHSSDLLLSNEDEASAAGEAVQKQMADTLFPLMNSVANYD